MTVESFADLDGRTVFVPAQNPSFIFSRLCQANGAAPVIDNSYAAEPSGMKLTGFIAVLGLILIAMGTYRSPAVALMPDVTRKPLRSRANAIINLMGAVGGIIYLLIAAVMYL